MPTNSYPAPARLESARGRPRAAIPSTEKTLSLPSDLVQRVDIWLFSEIEGRVPHGAWARYVSSLIREDLARKAGSAPVASGDFGAQT